MNFKIKSIAFVFTTMFFSQFAHAQNASPLTGYWYSYFDKDKAEKSGIEIPDFCLDTDQCINPVIVKFNATKMIRCFIKNGDIPDDVTLDTVLDVPLQLNLDVDSLRVTYTFNVSSNEITLLDSDGLVVVWKYDPKTDTINNKDLHHISDEQAANLFGCTFSI